MPTPPRSGATALERDGPARHHAAAGPRREPGYPRAQVRRRDGHRAARPAPRSARSDRRRSGDGGGRGEPRVLRRGHGARPAGLADLVHAGARLPPVARRQDAFGRSVDPLGQAQYPILGDASVQQSRTASRTWLSARVERGFDWAAFGDLSSTDFASGLSLAQYRRSVTGLAARVTTGAVTWSAFGSLTAQSLRQLQIRGAGISGPYQLAGGILPGTEYLRLETRDLQNPERAVATLALTRFVDYQIDYVDGVVLFKQPIPAADASGNPMFIVATFEAAAGGQPRLVAGARAALDMRPLVEGLGLDSLRIGVTAVNAEQAIDRYRLVGSDVRAFRFGAVDVSAEVAYAEHGDSTGLATSAKASYSLFGGAVTVGGGYMRVGRQFTNPSNVALQPGLTEENLRGGLKLGGTEL